MRKKSSITKKLLINLNRLLPFIGSIFIISGAMGLIFIQNRLDKPQEIRSQAMENNCNSSCTSNKDCDINLRCYNNVCRLATNPDNPNCSLSKPEKPKKIPLKKGDDVIPDTKTNYENIDIVKPSVRTNELVGKKIPANETALDLIIKMLKNKQQSMPTTIILIGIIILLSSTLLYLIRKLVKHKPK